LSKVILGTSSMSRDDRAGAFALLDEWLRLGGSVLDTAQAYGDGEAERVMGEYIESTGCRRDVAIITKGCHPIGDGAARVTSNAIRDDLSASLARLRTDYVDVYMLHRDDPSVSVEPIIEALNQQLESGRVRSFGASNWSRHRLEEANAFAARRGLAGFSSSSCQVSLAVQREPLCEGCLSARDPADLEFHRQTKLPLVAWAALAGGFFREGPRTDPDVVRVYESPENVERSRRAAQLSRAMGLTRSQVALAWVLNQDFPAFAVVATQRADHLRELAVAADVILSAGSVAWLDLEAERPSELARGSGTC
jgi:aryl-alcohol dehydrogenase-like predicted oxidoreductase